MLKHVLWPFKQLVKYWLDPKICPVCDGFMERGRVSMCRRCELAVPVSTRHGVESLTCRDAVVNGPAPVLAVEAFFDYSPDSPYGELVREAKYLDRPEVAQELGAAFAHYLLASQPRNGFHATQIDILLPMPMHWTKAFRRGYNQTEYIAKGMADVLGCTVADNLFAVRGHRAQAGLSGSKRIHNLKDCFAVADVQTLDGKVVAIVDDIITTGTSMGEAVQALMRGGARPAGIVLLALGRAGNI